MSDKTSVCNRCGIKTSEDKAQHVDDNFLCTSCAKKLQGLKKSWVTDVFDERERARFFLSTASSGIDMWCYIDNCVCRLTKQEIKKFLIDKKIKAKDFICMSYDRKSGWQTADYFFIKGC